MYELYFDKIDITTSKKNKKLTFKNHEKLNDIYVPSLIFIFPLVWFLIIAYENKQLTQINLFITIVSFLLLIIGIISLYINLSRIWKLKSIEGDLTSEINREICLKISKENGVKLHTDNKNCFIGIYEKSLPFKQIITIIYNKDKILFNARNKCIGYNGTLGRPISFGKSSKKIYLIYKREIEEYLKTNTEKNKNCP